MQQDENVQRALLAHYLGGEEAMVLYSQHNDPEHPKSIRQLAGLHGMHRCSVERRIKRAAQRLRRLRAMGAATPRGWR